MTLAVYFSPPVYGLAQCAKRSAPHMVEDQYHEVDEIDHSRRVLQKVRGYETNAQLRAFANSFSDITV